MLTKKKNKTKKQVYIYDLGLGIGSLHMTTRAQQTNKKTGFTEVLKVGTSKDIIKEVKRCHSECKKVFANYICKILVSIMYTEFNNRKMSKQI